MPASFNFPAQFPSYKDPFDTPDTIWWWRGFWILLCRRNAKCLACLKFGNCPGFHLKCAVGTQYDRRLSTLIPQLLSTLPWRNNRHVKLHEIQMTSLMWNKWKKTLELVKHEHKRRLQRDQTKDKQMNIGLDSFLQKKENANTERKKFP